MAALPPNWEWDYDGTRWFYRYKPNGHVQFHFPKEGDEFPDFFDAMSPIPDLSPEEKLESQQQMKRRTGSDPDPKSKMHATGGPLADFGMSRSGFGGPLDDDNGSGFFYQPENLMYLGPGAYNDISPLADEDERDEIPRDRRKSRDSASPKKERTTLELAGSDKTGVSPLQSETNTPSIKNSVPVRESAIVPESVAEEAVLIINTQELPGPSQPTIPSPGVPLLDSVEKPRPTAAPSVQSQPWNPVGFVAEMATEHTAPAHIETHPDPVEMGDNAVLAPIETRIMDPDIAELPERTSPSDAKPPASSTHDLLHQTSMSDHALYGATFGTGSRPQNSSPTNSGKARTSTRPLAVPPKLPLDDSLPEVVPHQTQSSTSTPTTQPFSIKRKPSKTGAKQGTFKPYVPGSTPNPIPDKSQPKEPEFVRREHRNSLAREASLMLGPRQSYETSNMPSVLQPPQIPPKQPLESTQTLYQHPVNPARPDATRTQTEPSGVLTEVGRRRHRQLYPHHLARNKYFRDLPNSQPSDPESTPQRRRRGKSPTPSLRPTFRSLSRVLGRVSSVSRLRPQIIIRLEIMHLPPNLGLDLLQCRLYLCFCSGLRAKPTLLVNPQADHNNTLHRSVHEQDRGLIFPNLFTTLMVHLYLRSAKFNLHQDLARRRFLGLNPRLKLALLLAHNRLWTLCRAGLILG
ncbi:hypothetical protein CGLO_14222 [Colletotrichum gloeosporioides Cg-14]|uniref:WW domain-containing protein n=1 Tax=Colletotrichum gloeosporioides (strain Cg-14) TaxID=1237896 RepID=T0JUQ3_COLGC|nr:hypothetical protein CGLO_14222 [Colletotrichum gloeosporioides Cg-14]